MRPSTRGGPSHQVEVSILRRAVFGRHLFDVALLDELVGRVHDVLLTPQTLIHLQQLVHLLLRNAAETQRDDVQRDGNAQSLSRSSEMEKSEIGYTHLTTLVCW